MPTHEDLLKAEYAEFAEAVKDHQMTVLKDDGFYRHLRFRRPDSYVYTFDIVTWPGYLAYTGDMGCYVFSRIPDMIEFFRGESDYYIDRDYWAQKHVGADRDGVREFSEERFKAAILHDFEQFEDVDGAPLTAEERDDLWACIKHDILSVDDLKHDGVRAALEFEWIGTRGTVREIFADFYEHRLDDFTPRFRWCCFALRYAVKQYDAAKAAEPSVVNPV